MITFLFAVFLGLRTLDHQEVPRCGSPLLTIAALEKRDGALILNELLTREVGVTIHEPEGIGEGQVKKRIEMKHIPTITSCTLDSNRARFYGLDGKEISYQKVSELVRQPIPVLLSRDGNLAGSMYLQIAKEGTLVVVLQPPPKD